MQPALRYAREALEKGHELVIVRAGTKAPMFRDWPLITPEKADVERLVGIHQCNWGFKLHGLLVADKDASDRQAYDWMRVNRIHRSPMEVQTKRGVHFFFRLQEEVRAKIKFLGMPLDLLTGNRVAIGPGSYIRETDYTYALREGKEICPPEQLPVFPVNLLQKPPVFTPSSLVSPQIESLRKYIRHIVAVEGQGGHNSCFRAACKLADAGLTVDEILAELIAWNETNALPKFSLPELTNKAVDACKRRIR